MIAAPMAMNRPRNTRDSAIPMSSTFCWYFGGTLNEPMISAKTKRLSTLSAFSVT